MCGMRGEVELERGMDRRVDCESGGLEERNVTSY